GFAGGGGEQVFDHLANHWKRSGHQVEYWVIRKQGPLRTRLNPNIPVVVLGSGVRALQRLTLTCYLRKLLASRKPDAIFSTVTYANCLLGGAAGGLQQTGTVTVLREANVLENIRKTG